ncbi:hypothetical protein KR100_01290 [Synechococcus sp. KORDI-100]|nr:hypothetical protein KR100_01290 [Synechococcus sp. KORDI-100]
MIFMCIWKMIWSFMIRFFFIRFHGFRNRLDLKRFFCLNGWKCQMNLLLQIGFLSMVHYPKIISEH